MDLYTEYTVISLFSGIGGLDLGVRDVLPARTICYVEREIKAASVLAERASEGLLDEAPIYSDVKTFPTELFAGKVDIDFLLSGFPCQPFSVAGKQEGSDDERNLWPDTIRIIRELRPRYVFLENVPGLVAHEYFGTILGELAEAGYDAEWGCFKASDIGASHRRERLFILAHATGINSERPISIGDGRREPEAQAGNRGSDLAHAGHAERQGRISDEESGIWVTRDEPAPQGSDLAHAESDIRRTSGDDRRVTSDGASDQELAHAASAREVRNQSQYPQGRGIELDGEELAHAKHDGHTASERTSRLRRGQSYTGWPKEQRGIEQSARSGAESSLQPELAHANGGGSRENLQQAELWTTGTEQSPCDCGETESEEDEQVTRGREGNINRPELPEFPPGPGDPAWEWIVEHYPELAPATCKHGTPVRSGMYETESPVRNVDDAWKISDRVAALMMLGNAVVPAQAAYALRELMKRDSVV